MNREIKFRGLDIDSGKWTIGNLVIDTDGNYQIWDYACHESDCYTYKNVNKESVGQYTGLKDKNGKEIYEGDKIRYSNSMEHGEGVIGFSAGFIIEWDLSTVKTDHPMIMQPLFYFQCSAEIEVIGNIHEKGDNNG